MHRRQSITSLLIVASVLAGCGGTAEPAPTVATTAGAPRSVQRGGTITVRGQYAPDTHGPYTLHGRYRVRFTQRGAGVDFGAEVPFTAHLEAPAANGPGQTIALFQRAAQTGVTTVRADGRFQVVVDYGDSPYVLVLAPLR